MQTESVLPAVPADSRPLALRAGWITTRRSSLLALLLPTCIGIANAQTRAPVAPYGERPIGYTSFTLESGLDELTPQPADRRRLLVEIWFPAEKPGTEPKPWASDSMGAALARGFPFPGGFQSDIKTHAWLDAKPVPVRVPVIVFSHGLSFPPTLYQSFFEDLASRGYAVLAVSHPHGAVMIEYPDGTRLGMALWPQLKDEGERQRMLAQTADRWAADLSVVIDSIRAGAIPGGPMLDSSRIALLGHSLGGTAVGKLSRDNRISAVAVMEGDVREMEDDKARGSINVSVPLLHLIGGYNRLELERASYLPGPNAPVLTAVIHGTGHAYFSDLIYFYRSYAKRDWRDRHRYEIDPDRVIRISSDYLAAFFDWQLRDVTGSVLLRRRSYADRVEGPQLSGYPEVDLTIAIY